MSLPSFCALLRPLLFLPLALGACASSAPSSGAGFPEEAPGPELAGPEATPVSPSSPAPAPSSPAPAPAAACDAFLRPGVLRRGTVVRAVDRGLGQWLQGVTVAPVRSGNRFQGWRVERLHPDDPCFRALDVVPGDVVTRINGATLERPEQANGVFQSLRAAPTVRVELLRAGSARTVTLQIAD
jgi:S1-C subfamily serine protease